eukprot:10392434-Lingulodinium_polyedra.AAC.1
MGVVAIGGLEEMVEALKQVLCFNNCSQGTFNHITGPSILNNQFKTGKLENQGKNLTRWCGRPR